MKIDILGIKVNQINIEQAVETAEQWLFKSGKHYIVTPNVEIVMLAQKDRILKKILNSADLAIPDSSRFGWFIDQKQEKNLILKYIKWPLFLFPKSSFLYQFDVVTGTDLMEKLVSISSEKGFTIGLLGGMDGVALKLKERLLEKYPNLNVTFAENGGEINYYGQSLVSARQSNSPPSISSGPARSASRTSKLVRFGTSRLAQTETGLRSDFAPSIDIPPTDILFVAFGAVKQEKWIASNLFEYPVKVMMGVGGAFDYLSGNIPRSPKFIRLLGFEWLFRLIVQPWRVARFLNLIKFVCRPLHF